jgi:hypothetical protein
MNTNFSSLRLDEWRETRDTLQSYARVIGKIRQALTPPQKHWWHASLRVDGVGLTTTPMLVPTTVGENGRSLTFLLDLVNHQTRLTTSQGQTQAIPLEGQSLAEFCQQIKAALAAFGLTITFDDSVCSSAAKRVDEAGVDEAGVYDKTAVSRYWQTLSRIDLLFKQFRHGFREESSPVQLWPHHFDLALLWFSGRLVPDQDPDDPEYADEQMNFGFVTGDDSIADPYFYATAYPTPDAFTEQPLPDGAYWHMAGWTGAILPYAMLTQVDTPDDLLLNFLQTTHRAGSRLMRQEGKSYVANG